MPDARIGADGSPFRMVIKNVRDEVLKLKDDSNVIFDNVEQQAKLSYRRVLSVARASYSLMDAVLQALGINIGEVVRLGIQAGLSTITVLTPIFTAELSTPYTAAQGLIGLAELELALSAIAQAAAGQAEISRSTAQTTRSLFALNSLIGTFNYL